MTAETAPAWEPGDPLMPDNGLNGGISSVTMSAPARADVIAEGGLEPPWFRPLDATASGVTSSRRCNPCGVRWSGDEPCWMCGGEESP